MKKILLLSSVFVSAFFISKSASAQYQGNGYQDNGYQDNGYQQNNNIDVQPAWGPTGYGYAENYYLPDVEAYYNVPRRQFIYFDGGRWVYSSSLPGRCGNYDLYSGYKVVLNEREPWFHFNDHRARFAPFRFRHDQVVIRDGRNFGHGGFGRPEFADRDRDFGYARRGNFDRRQDWGRGDFLRGGGFDNNRHEDHNGRGRGRW
jgi:hypothetical protein